MTTLESLNNPLFQGFENTEISNLTAIVGGDKKQTVGAGGAIDCITQTDCGTGDIDETNGPCG